MGKIRNIVFLFDGTGAKRKGPEAKYQSNVASLSYIVPRRPGNGIVQSCYYYEGVGTRKDEGKGSEAWGKCLYGRIEEAYLDLQQEMAIADRNRQEAHIYISGFSRGAHAARWFAALIDFAGIPMDGGSEQPGLTAFNNKDKKAVVKLIESGKYVKCPSIDMIGVWDTVDATIGDNFDAGVLPGSVLRASHAMALNEKRNIFDVERFDNDSRVEEVWFNGSHTDVGGGYENAHLSKIAMAWMCKRFVAAGLRLKDGWQLPADFDYDKCEYNESNEGWWIALNVVQTGHTEHDREVKDGDIIHWTVGLMKDKFASINPPLPPKEMVAYQQEDYLPFVNAAIA